LTPLKWKSPTFRQGSGLVVTAAQQIFEQISLKGFCVLESQFNVVFAQKFLFHK
jgi:hypothetical protein